MTLKERAGNHVTAGILTGGGSRRFGQNKSLYSWMGRTLVEWTLEGAGFMTNDIVLLAKDSRAYHFTGASVLEDGYSVSTPLNGILSVIPRVHDWLLLLACDIPFFDVAVLELLWENKRPDQAALIRSGGMLQPFLALYPRSLLHHWVEAFHAGEYHIRRVVEDMPRIVLEEEFLLERKINPGCLTNINTPEDLESLTGDSFRSR